MEGAIISLDVSKGSSHFRAFTKQGTPFTKVKVISHDREGFAALMDTADRMKEQFGRMPAIVYEHTGVYSSVLARAMRQKGMECYPISPLLSAGERKSGIRHTKNDSIDCTTIATVYYKSGELRKAENPDKDYLDLRQMVKAREHLVKITVIEKNCYMRLLDEIWPNVDKIADPYSSMMLDIVTKFGTPEKVKSEKGILSAIKQEYGGTGKKGTEFAHAMAEYAKTHISGVDADCFDVEEIKDSARELVRLFGRLDALEKRIASLAKSKKELGLLESVPGIGGITAATLMACIRDCARFRDAKSMISYAGIDPTVNESGEKDGKHLSITKKGDSLMRKTLFLIVNAMIKQKDNAVARYVEKKRKDGLPPKAAKIAGCSKLVKILYAMLKNGTCYEEKVPSSTGTL